MDQNRNPFHLNMKLTRAKFESLVDDLVQKTLGPCKAALKDAGLSPNDIKEVVLVGGMTRMPVQQVVKNSSAQPHKGVNPDEVVAVGAAIRRAWQGDVKTSCCWIDALLGIETLGGCSRLIERNTTVPTRNQIFDRRG